MHLDGLKVAVLVTDGYEPSELTEPVAALRDAGADVTIVSDHDGTIRGKTDADTASVDLTLDTARAEDYGALLLPGGVKNPDTMRQNQRGVAFVRSFADAGKPIAAICHAPGCWSRPISCAGAASRAIRRSARTSATPARSGSTRRSSPTRGSSPAERRRTSRPSTPRCSRSSPRGTRPGARAGGDADCAR